MSGKSADLDFHCPDSRVGGEGVGVHAEVQLSGGRGDQDGRAYLEGAAVADPGDEGPAWQLRGGELSVVRGVVSRRRAGWIAAGALRGAGPAEVRIARRADSYGRPRGDRDPGVGPFLGGWDVDAWRGRATGIR